MASPEFEFKRGFVGLNSLMAALWSSWGVHTQMANNAGRFEAILLKLMTCFIFPRTDPVSKERLPRIYIS